MYSHTCHIEDWSLLIKPYETSLYPYILKQKDLNSCNWCCTIGMRIFLIKNKTKKLGCYKHSHSSNINWDGRGEEADGEVCTLCSPGLAASPISLLPMGGVCGRSLIGGENSLYRKANMPPLFSIMTLWLW